MNGNDRWDVWREVVQWLRVAGSDQRVAKLCIDADPPLCDAAAYHCQQGAEKLLKGFLVYDGTHARKTHDLETLASLVQTQHDSIGPLLAPIREWTAWSVAYRYPGEAGVEPEPSAEEIRLALNVIIQLDAALRSLAPQPTDPKNMTQD